MKKLKCIIKNIIKKYLASLLIISLSPIVLSASSMQVFDQDWGTAGTINTWFDNDSACGNIGDVYLNRDLEHAPLTPVTHYKQLTFEYYTFNRSANLSPIPNQVTIGNASIAYYSNYEGLVSVQRSNFLNSQYEATRAYQQYIDNDFFWYPEHLDHDAIDKYHANLPYTNNSQGSSGSEMDEMKKFVYTMASFKPSVKQKLVDEGLLMPTIQMIFRFTRVGSDTARYLSGEAHPCAFDNNNNIDQMTNLAHEIEINNIPPMIQLEVLEDTYNGIREVDYFDGQYSKTERVFDTPCSISRIHKNRRYTQKIVVSAENSYDVNGLPLTYHWTVLRGDPQHVRITNLNAEGSIASIEFDYQETADVTIDENMSTSRTVKSNRVEVGAFVDNGTYYSAPGFITSYTFPYEDRTYDNNNLVQTIYTDGYAYEGITSNPTWHKDAFHYDVNDILTGWSRYAAVETTTPAEFTAEGCIIKETDGSGITTKADIVYYSGYELNYTISNEIEYSYVSKTTTINSSVSGNLDGLETHSGNTPVFIESNNKTLLLRKMPEHGTVDFNTTTGEYTYYPDPEFSGYDVFAVRTYDYTRSKYFMTRITVEVNDTGAPKDTFSVSGTITHDGSPLINVSITLLNKTFTTNSDGFFNISNLVAGSYIIKPVLEGYTFDPAEQLVTVGPTKNNTNFNAIANTYDVSGTITFEGNPLANVIVNIGGKSTVTNSSGYYKIEALSTGNYTITPNLESYGFIPTSYNIELKTNIFSKNFTATQETFSISGKIQLNNSGIKDIVVSANGKETKTLADGSYTISYLAADTYFIVPSHDSYTFNPSIRTLNLQENISNIDFEASVYTPPRIEIDHFEIALLTKNCIIGKPVMLSIKACDIDGDMLVSYNGTINILIINGSSATKTAVITNGQCLLELTIENPGPKVTISVESDQGKTSNDLELTFASPEITLSGFNLSLNKQSYKPNDALELTVQALDNNNNKFTSYSYDNITVKSNIGTVSPEVISLINGEAIHNLTVDTKMPYAVTVEIWLEIDGAVMSDTVSLLVQPSFAASSEEICVFPNPARVNGSIQFSPLPDSSKILLYTISGSLVREVNITDFGWTWDLTNDDRSNIAPGVYIYIIKKNDSVFKKGKIAILPK
ncbi:MAG: T9SS type A sorting domain-containing protein [Bacteroidota bacterium]